MSDELFKDQYRIKSARANWHDYNHGWHFITICTHDMVCCFGTVEEDVMVLNDLGRKADEYLAAIPIHYPEASVPLYVVMPNHIHAIIIVEDNELPGPRIMDTTEETETGMKMQIISQQRGRLSECIGKYKAAVTRYANQTGATFKWQSRFHDHIIRNQTDGNAIADYIENNPAKWTLDRFYKVATIRNDG